MQSALHETLKRRRAVSVRLSADQPEMQQFVEAANKKLQEAPAPAAMSAMARAVPGATTPPAAPAAVPALSCAAMYAEIGWADMTGNTTRREALTNELKFSTCDPLWIESVTTYLAWQAGQAPIPYVTYDTLNDFVIDLPQPQAAGSPLVVGVIADWGTGMEDASWLLGRLLTQNVDLIIHLGDIYYSGTTNEVAENFMSLITNAGVTVPVYSLAGNHDMYSGGVGYYGMLQQLRQPASYFCLRNAAWQILAMDTGYNDKDVFTVNTNLTSLQPAEAAWHLDKINDAGGRKTILLSHHQLFSPFGDGVGQDPVTKNALVTNTNLWNVFGAVLPKMALWLWGHEHSCNLFQPYIGLACGRCVGASAVPERDPTAYAVNKALNLGTAAAFPQLVVAAADPQAGQPICLPQNSDGEFFHCYAILRLAPAGAKSTAEYYQIDSVNNAQESLLYSETI